MDKQRIFITGATGFVGRAVLNNLQARAGVDAIAVTRQTGAMFPPKVAVETVTDYAGLKADSPTDIVIHLAETADMGAVQRDPDAILQAARETTAALVETFGGRVVFGSSAAIYGDASDMPHRTDQPLPEGGSYARMKRGSEARVIDAGGTALRLSNILCYREHDVSVIGDILRQLNSDGALRVHRLTPVRDYLALDDAAEAIATATLSTKRGCFNLGSGQSRSVGEVVATFLATTGQPDRTIEETRPSEAQSILRLDISQTRKALGWAPRTSFEDAITGIIDEYRRKKLKHG